MGSGIRSRLQLMTPGYSLLSDVKLRSSSGYAYSLRLLASTAVIFSTMLPLAHALDLPEGAKAYYKDIVSSAPGTSEGVGPTTKPQKQQGVDIGRRESREYDFKDESSSALMMKAWESLNRKDEGGVLAYTLRCIELYEADAKKQQAQLGGFARTGSEAESSALNDVAAAYFIQGEFYKYAKDWAKAKAAYQKVVNNFPFAQYWDPRGWWWKPAEISAGEIEKISKGYYESK